MAASTGQARPEASVRRGAWRGTRATPGRVVLRLEPAWAVPHPAAHPLVVVGHRRPGVTAGGEGDGVGVIIPVGSGADVRAVDGGGDEVFRREIGRIRERRPGANRQVPDGVRAERMQRGVAGARRSAAGVDLELVIPGEVVGAAEQADAGDALVDDVVDAALEHAIDVDVDAVAGGADLQDVTGDGRLGDGERERLGTVDELRQEVLPGAGVRRQLPAVAPVDEAEGEAGELAEGGEGDQHPHVGGGVDGGVVVGPRAVIAGEVGPARGEAPLRGSGRGTPGLGAGLEAPQAGGAVRTGERVVQVGVGERGESAVGLDALFGALARPGAFTRRHEG